MSVHVMSWVLRHSEEKLGNRLVLLVLADHANEDGGKSWSSVGTIAHEARLSRSQTQRCLRSLEESGAIVETGKGLKGTHEYRVVMEGPHIATPGGPHPGEEGAASTTPGGRILQPEPSLEPSEEQPSKDLAAVAAYDPKKGMKVDGKNYPWDALVYATQADEKVEAGQIGRALKLIRGYIVDASSPQTFFDARTGETHIATQIQARARLYRQRWPNVELTPTALAKNWARVTTATPSGSLDDALEAAQRGIDSARRTA